jgi:hypothetical protein
MPQAWRLELYYERFERFSLLPGGDERRVNIKRRVDRSVVIIRRAGLVRKAWAARRSRISEMTVAGRDGGESMWQREQKVVEMLGSVATCDYSIKLDVLEGSFFLPLQAERRSKRL